MKPGRELDMSVSYKVIEEMARRGFEVEVSNIYNPKSKEFDWRCVFNKINKQQEAFHAFAPSLQEAICLAALKAVGVIVE